MSRVMELMTTARAVRRARLRAGMSVASLAKAAGISDQTVYEIEKDGRKRGPRIETVAAIADALGVEIEALIPEEAA